MDITKLLQSLEEFIFDIACLVILIPKTFFKLSFFPGRVIQYLSTELQKPADERFDRFASPFILWFVTGIFPHFLVLSIFASLPSIKLLLPTGDLSTHFLQLPVEGRFAAFCAFGISLPVALAVVMVRERKEELSKTTLRLPLYAASYCMCPILLAAVPSWYLWEALLRGRHRNITDYIDWYRTPLGVWFCWIALSLFRQYLHVGWKRAFILLAKTYLIFIVVLILMELAILFIVELLHM